MSIAGYKKFDKSYIWDAKKTAKRSKLGVNH